MMFVLLYVSKPRRWIYYVNICYTGYGITELTLHFLQFKGMLWRKIQTVDESPKFLQFVTCYQSDRTT